MYKPIRLEDRVTKIKLNGTKDGGFEVCATGNNVDGIDIKSYKIGCHDHVEIHIGISKEDRNAKNNG